MVSHKHRFIFIHIPKTAGTSIELALRDETCQLLPGEWDQARIHHTPLNHLTLPELVDYGILTPLQLKSYFKFCFVRNPWDRLISEIFCPWMSPWFRGLTVEQRVRRACDLAATGKGIGNHLRLQHDFVNATGLQVDFIGRFERLDEDFDYICKLLGTNVHLLHLNRSSHRPYQEYYDEATQALTAATYRRDIDSFHYKFGDVAGGEVTGRGRQTNADEHTKKFGGDRKITAYPLYHQSALLQRAAGKQQQAKATGWDQSADTHRSESTQSLADVDHDLANVDQQGWQLCCPVAFEAVWNGGPQAADIEIHVERASTDQSTFVQSQLGDGVLTFHSGYQFKTESAYSLWVRGPINTPKDGLWALERLFDTSTLPCTIVIHWRFTRPNQTIRFAVGEPFATLLLYPNISLDALCVEMVQQSIAARP